MADREINSRKTPAKILPAPMKAPYLSPDCHQPVKAKAPMGADSVEIKAAARQKPSQPDYRALIAKVQALDENHEPPATLHKATLHKDVKPTGRPGVCHATAPGPKQPTHAHESDESEQHHAQHPGQVAGEYSRMVNHTKEAASELRETKIAADALNKARVVEKNLKAARDIADTALHDASMIGKDIKAVRDIAKLGVPLEAMEESAHQTRSAHMGGHGKLGMGLSAVGMVGGSIQLAEGISHLANGRVLAGSKDIAAGAGYVGSGVAELLASSVKHAGKAAKAAPVLAGAASIVEGGYEFYHGWASGNGEKQALGGLKFGSGILLGASAFVASAPVSVPLAIVGTTVIAGVAVYENWDTIKSWSRSAGGTIAGAIAQGNAAIGGFNYPTFY
ncbi:MAG: hypothetical protein HY692_02425 [Cyanobacteria bacterium NC_groundwater_1444_Ag_S-0.65um_54_12]|nr:hypothetical protein [Cyanobacteria bacterium NC_groundwater_1444_Ag_S-0.65um_54_12]